MWMHLRVQSGVYHFGVNVALASCLSPGISLQITCLDAFSVVECSVLFWGHYELDLNL